MNDRIQLVMGEIVDESHTNYCLLKASFDQSLFYLCPVDKIKAFRQWQSDNQEPWTPHWSTPLPEYIRAIDLGSLMFRHPQIVR